MEWRDPFEEIVFAESIERAHCETTGVDLGALFEQGLDLVVDGEMSREGLLADRREAPRPRREQDAWAVQDD
jgi:hypothetical protein